MILREDRDRIARDLHDHVVQDLYALGIGLHNMANALPAYEDQITDYTDTVDRVIAAIRTTIFRLQPDRNDPVGVKSRLLHVIAQHTAQLGFTVGVRFSGPLDLQVQPALAHDILAVTREALSNIARHAQATRTEIALHLYGTWVTLRVTDNGRGIGQQAHSSGLANLYARAERAGGTMRLDSPAGGGTRITWTATTESGGSDTSSPTLAA